MHAPECISWTRLPCHATPHILPHNHHHELHAMTPLPSPSIFPSWRALACFYFYIGGLAWLIRLLHEQGLWRLPLLRAVQPRWALRRAHGAVGFLHGLLQPVDWRGTRIQKQAGCHIPRAWQQRRTRVQVTDCPRRALPARMPACACMQVLAAPVRARTGRPSARCPAWTPPSRTCTGQWACHLTHAGMQGAGGGRGRGVGEESKGA